MVKKTITKRARCRRALALLFACTLVPAARAEDFLRGDANGDGRVSYSDAFAVVCYIFAETQETIDSFTCLDALDANDSGGWPDVVDPAAICAYVFGIQDALPEPFPSPGPDPTEDTITCESHGGPGPIEDPQAAVAVVSAKAPEDGDTKARILVDLSASTSVGALYLELRLPPGLLDETADDPIATRIDRLPGPWNDAHYCGREPDGILRIAYMLAQNDKDPIPACTSRPVIEVLACLAPGTPAGEYPMAIETAELTDFDSRRAIYPQRAGSVIILSHDVPEDAVCSAREVDPEVWGWPFPRNVVTRIELRGTDVPQGRYVEVPLVLNSNGDVRAFSFSIDIDEERLSVAEVLEPPLFPEASFRVLQVDSENRTPGNTGVEEGFLAGAVVLPPEDIGFQLPASTDIEVFCFCFDIVSDEERFETALRFVDGAPGPWPWQSMRNEVVASARRYRPGTGELVLQDAVVRVEREDTFLRGDSNGDATVNLSDAVRTLGFLFLGLPPPSCSDAGDANDDGILNMTDAVYTLLHLFTGGPAPPEPYPDSGLDPTPDDFHCVQLDRV